MFEKVKHLLKKRFVIIIGVPFPYMLQGLAFLWFWQKRLGQKWNERCHTIDERAWENGQPIQPIQNKQ